MRSRSFFQKPLDFSPRHAIIILASGRLAQLVEHSLDVRRVSGSSPLSSTIHEKSELSAGGPGVRISCLYHRYCDPRHLNLLYLSPGTLYLRSRAFSVSYIRLLATDQMEWVRRMNCIRNQAEEMVKADQIYV